MSCLIHLHHTTPTSNQTTVTVAVTAALSASEAESSVDSANHLVEKTYPPRHSSLQHHPILQPVRSTSEKIRLKTTNSFCTDPDYFSSGPPRYGSRAHRLSFVSRQLTSVTPATYTFSVILTGQDTLTPNRSELAPGSYEKA